MVLCSFWTHSACNLLLLINSTSSTCTHSIPALHLSTNSIYHLGPKQMNSVFFSLTQLKLCYTRFITWSFQQKLSKRCLEVWLLFVCILVYCVRKNKRFTQIFTNAFSTLAPMSFQSPLQLPLTRHSALLFMSITCVHPQPFKSTVTKMFCPVCCLGSHFKPLHLYM